jgi:serpin B
MRTLLALPLVVLGLAASPARADKPSAPANPLPGSIAKFTDSLYGAARREPGNLFLSPFSVHAALSMTREGAGGGTAREMDETLHLPQGGAGDGYLRLTTALAPRSIEGDGKKVQAYELSVANALWVQDGFAIDAAFTTRLGDAYGSPLTRVDFADTAKARDTVNAWVARQTREKILTILPEGQPPADTRLILTNAVYFKAQWEDPFSERATKPEAFHRLDGTEVKVPMMRRTGHYAYRETDGAQILELPYLMDDLSMFVVLPKTRGGLPALEESSTVSSAVGKASHALVSVTLPKFTFTWGGDLSGTLQTLGMRSAFDAKTADFSRMTAAEKLFIGIVLHKAFVAVDENGTEAAAVTAVGMRATSAPGEPPRPIEFRADHPFQFLIVHRATGTILFVGRLADPS